MAEIVNLRMARKARVRAEKDSAASANRAAFGRTRAERAASEKITAARDDMLDGAKRER